VHKDTAVAPSASKQAEETPVESADKSKAEIILVESADESKAEATPIESADESKADGVKIMAYCVKCKQKRTMLQAREVLMKNGRPAMRGVCSVCGTRLNRIGWIS
ncbi:MAG TPA: DUF5679 domain-containing protein, partial [Ktedonobacteraceae bacterium]